MCNSIKFEDKKMCRIKTFFPSPPVPPEIQLPSAEKPLSPFSYVSFQNCAMSIYKIHNPFHKCLFSTLYVLGIEYSAYINEQESVFLALKECAV